MERRKTPYSLLVSHFILQEWLKGIKQLSDVDYESDEQMRSLLNNISTWIGLYLYSRRILRRADLAHRIAYRRNSKYEELEQKGLYSKEILSKLKEKAARSNTLYKMLKAKLLINQYETTKARDTIISLVCKVYDDNMDSIAYCNVKPSSTTIACIKAIKAYKIAHEKLTELAPEMLYVFKNRMDNAILQFFANARKLVFFYYTNYDPSSI